MKIVLAGEACQRPNVICISDNKSDINKSINWIVSKSTYDYYYVHLLNVGTVYTGPWGVNEEEIYLERGSKENNVWVIK